MLCEHELSFSELDGNVMMPCPPVPMPAHVSKTRIYAAIPYLQLQGLLLIVHCLGGWFRSLPTLCGRVAIIGVASFAGCSIGTDSVGAVKCLSTVARRKLLCASSYGTHRESGHSWHMVLVLGLLTGFACFRDPVMQGAPASVVCVASRCGVYLLCLTQQ